MLDVVPPVVRNGGRGCLYTAEPTDGQSTDMQPSVMFTFNAMARQSIMSIDPPGIWTETLQSQLGIRARTNDESQLGIRPLFSITWSVKGHATISDVYL